MVSCSRAQAALLPAPSWAIQRDWTSDTAPATCGVAMDVPDLVMPPAVTFMPGATKSSMPDRLLMQAISPTCGASCPQLPRGVASVSNCAPVDSVRFTQAGLLSQSAAASLPEAAATATPWSKSARIGAKNSESLQGLESPWSQPTERLTATMWRSPAWEATQSKAAMVSSVRAR